MTAASTELLAALDAAEAEGTVTSSASHAPVVPAPPGHGAPLPRPGLTRTYAVLSRFAAVFPDQALPGRFDQLPLHQQMQLQDADPELAMVLRGTMPAALEAQVLSGAWPDVKPAPPSPEEQRAALVAELTAGGTVNPFAPGGNLSAQLQLARVDPMAAEQLRLAAAPLHQAAQQQAAEAAEAHRRQQLEAQNATNRQRQIAAARASFGLRG